MALLEVLTLPDKRLRQRAHDVEGIDESTRTLLSDMLETMYATDGIGLAAIQIGVPKRIAVIDIGEKRFQDKPFKMINPEIIWTSDEKQITPDGCLSVPEQYAETLRPRALKAQFRDENDVLQKIEAEGLLAACIHHEIDHLNGVLFVDHLSPLKRQILVQRAIKLRGRGK
ncbi:Peptide deformylase [Candidatus Bealeia paramacronuclearis]|uniref:Peptide deformylase n=1 Tax=Candidatus Bealeia paramacronuclearis TaxID=1921001 RepID=A0ABZ2C2M2_9PROT|nr:Peptide deformylase [Candidatus Bealeia paramacronuclearis]